MTNKIRLIFLLFFFVLFSENRPSSDSEIQLMFFYNSKSGFVNSLYDYAHKKISPETYSCNLCRITYENWSRNDKWSEYLNKLPFEIDFVYKNSKNDLFPDINEFDLPAVLLNNNKKLSELVSKKEIDNFKNDTDLIKALNKKLLELDLIK